MDPEFIDFYDKNTRGVASCLLKMRSQGSESVAMPFRHSKIIYPHLLSKPRIVMSTLLPTIEKSTFPGKENKQIENITVRTLYHTMRVAVEQVSVMTELCYLLRYPARHGRKSGCPFSLRQMAIYQRFDHVKKTSRWILVQTPDDFSDELRSSLLSGEQERVSASNVHRQIFSVAEQDWRDYICYLDAELGTLVRCDCV